MNDGEPRLTHLDKGGEARMVEVSDKPETHRRAVAEGSIRMDRQTLEAIQAGTVEKGEVLQVARIAGIQAGKKTGDLIPLCHVLPGASVSLELKADPDLPGIRVRAEAEFRGRTGVEMEALTAASVALLTIYDMAKALDRGMVLSNIRLTSKEGGASGSWARSQDPSEESQEPPEG